MAIHKVDTEAIAATAAAIVTTNDNINTALNDLRSAGADLQLYWAGKARNTAVDLFIKILECNEARSVELQNFANVLQMVVNPGFVQSEQVNTSLADMFE